MLTNYNTVSLHAKTCIAHSGRLSSGIWKCVLVDVYGLTVSNVLDSLIATGNSFQMVRAEKVKKCLQQLLVVQERIGLHERF